LSADQVIRACMDRGVMLAWHDGRVKVNGKRDAVTSMLEQLKRYKTEIEAHFRPAPIKAKVAQKGELLTHGLNHPEERQVAQAAPPISIDQIDPFEILASHHKTAVAEKSDRPRNHIDAGWHAMAQAYHRHHFACPTCISAGQGRGLRCGAGTTLWAAYQQHFESNS